MLKIFLVEDEFVVREGIKKNINWSEHGYDFVGEAGDGELAFPMIQKLKPDIVITDIKMPFMDGLELSKLIKKEYPWMEIVILSGYAEFDYAKEAISLGVAHYLTKPISGDELIAEIDKLSEKINENKRTRELKEKYLHEMEENSNEEKRKLFQYMVTGSKGVTELIELAGKLKLDITALNYNVVLLNLKSIRHALEEYSGSMVDAKERINVYLCDEKILFFDRGTEGIAIIFTADSPEILEMKQQNAIDYIEEIMEDYPTLSYFGGIGQPVGRLGELSISFDAAGRAFAHRFFSSKSLFLDYKGIDFSVENTDASFDIKNIDPNGVDRKHVMEFLRQGEKDEAAFFVEEFFHSFGENAISSVLFRQYISMDVYFAVVAFVVELGYDRSEIKEFNIASGDIQDVPGTVSYLTGIIDKALELRNSNVNKKYNDVIDRVMEYIDEHYMDDELSLNYLASYVNFSPNHLSMMFSQQTGMSFIKYLTEYRMNKAKDLLRCTNKRSVDISVEVGYKDPHYFSYCFKKYQGVTPTQYRNGINGNAGEDDEFDNQFDNQI